MTNNTTKTRTEQLLTVMRILAWVAFVGFLISAGAVLVSYGVSIINPDASRKLYRGLDLYALRQYNFWHYTLSVSLMATVSILKALVWLLVIKTLSELTLANPFKAEVAQKLERISYLLFGTWVMAMTEDAHRGWLMNITGEVYGEWASGEYIFMAGLVFIISQIFKRGVELQSENELTV